MVGCEGKWAKERAGTENRRKDGRRRKFMQKGFMNFIFLGRERDGLNCLVVYWKFITRIYQLFVIKSLFLLSLRRDVIQPALVPVPLGNLVNCHADLLSDLNLPRVRPDGRLLEILPKQLHLPLFLAHAAVLLPLLHVFLVLLHAQLSHLGGL